jgi:uncharacterized protein (DUF2164 family)
MDIGKLPKDAQQQMADSIQRYWRENMDDPIGDLKAGLLLQFILDEIAPSIYNLAIRDAQAYLQEKVTDLEVNCFAPEFEHWRKNAGNRVGRKSSGHS